MKKFLKSIALMLLAGAFVLGFASCSNDSSDSSNTNSSSSSSSSSGSGNSGSGSSSSGATVSATYKLTENGKWQKIFLYSDDTCAWALEEAAGLYPDGIKKGKFTKSDGATWETGVFTINWTEKSVSQTKVKFEACNGDSTLTVVQGTGTLTSGSEDPKVFTLQK